MGKLALLSSKGEVCKDLSGDPLISLFNGIYAD